MLKPKRKLIKESNQRKLKKKSCCFLNIILCSVFEQQQQQQLFEEFMLFEQLIGLLNTRPIVPGKTTECLRLWETFTEQQQQQIYETLRSKLQAGKFVHYDPVKAIQENIPKVQIISADEYYRRFGTQANQDGWVRTFLKDQHKTIYVKQ